MSLGHSEYKRVFKSKHKIKLLCENRFLIHITQNLISFFKKNSVDPDQLTEQDPQDKSLIVIDEKSQ